MSRVVTVHYAIEENPEGGFTASASLRPGSIAVGEGETREEAVDDLREALGLLIEEIGIPDELALEVA
ncbi:MULTISPECIES: type II toxin-antitoxin system HicB family antitoxin [unclassified Nocardiopsis]|uniref:type II toxin-antitoxin system HicB family antitoxin n=1 Tax=Nocardiopsis TaxID=2013 RepID=UPI00387AE62E